MLIGPRVVPVCSVFICSACASHCSHCDARDRGAGKCDDDACDIGYTLRSETKICMPGEHILLLYHTAVLGCLTAFLK